MTRLPIRPPVDGAHIADYLLHVAVGRPQAEIAACRGVHRSSICRRMVSIEALRDCPLWDDILSALQAAALSSADRAGFVPLDPFSMSRAAGVLAGGDPAPQILPLGRALLRDGVSIATVRGQRLAVLTEGEGVVLERMPRGLVMAGLLAGWFDVVRSFGGGMTLLRPDPDFLDDLRGALGITRDLPIPALARLDLTPPQIAAAQGFGRAYRAGAAVGGPDPAGGPVMTAPCGVCGGPRIGFWIGWPGFRADAPAGLRGARLPVCGMSACRLRAIARMAIKAAPAVFPWRQAGLTPAEWSEVQSVIWEIQHGPRAPSPPPPCPPVRPAASPRQQSLL